MKLFTYKNKNIYYNEYGNGELIILLHGWGGSSKSLDALAQLFSQNFKVIIPDLPGFGQSDLPEKDWGIPEYSDCILALASSIKDRPFYLFGHSFGGAISLFITSKYHKRVKKLIVCAPSYKRENVKDLSEGKNSKSSTKNETIKKLLLPVRKLKYKLLHRRSDMMKVPELESNFKIIVSQDLTPLMKTIEVKTLILAAGQDKDVPLWHLEELNKLINNSEIKIYPDATHGLPLKYPDEVSKQINNFVKEK